MTHLVVALAIALEPGGRAEAAGHLLHRRRGRQATLIVTPAGESLLVDTGFPGSRHVRLEARRPAAGRDAQRIVAAARDAGVTRIDSLLITHFHADHNGGCAWSSQS